MDFSALNNLQKELEKIAIDGQAKLSHLLANGNEEVKPAIEIFERVNSAIKKQDINELNKILSDVSSSQK
jgi:hypothetical protein